MVPRGNRAGWPERERLASAAKWSSACAYGSADQVWPIPEVRLVCLGRPRQPEPDAPAHDAPERDPGTATPPHCKRTCSPGAKRSFHDLNAGTRECQAVPYRPPVRDQGLRFRRNQATPGDLLLEPAHSLGDGLFAGVLAEQPVQQVTYRNRCLALGRGLGQGQQQVEGTRCERQIAAIELGAPCSLRDAELRLRRKVLWIRRATPQFSTRMPKISRPPPSADDSLKLGVNTSHRS